MVQENCQEGVPRVEHPSSYPAQHAKQRILLESHGAMVCLVLTLSDREIDVDSRM